MFRRFPEDFPRGSEDVPKISRGGPEGFWEGGATSGLSGKSGALPGRVRSAGGAQGYFDWAQDFIFLVWLFFFALVCGS